MGTLFFSSGRPQCTVMKILLEKYVLLPPDYGPMGAGWGGNRWCPHMQQAWNLYGDSFVSRGGASKLSYQQKTSKTTMSWSIQPSLRVNLIQGRTEHAFRKKLAGWRHWCHSIGLDSLFQKNLNVRPKKKKKKRTVKPGDAFENTAFEQWFENVRGCTEAGLH